MRRPFLCLASLFAFFLAAAFSLTVAAILVQSGSAGRLTGLSVLTWSSTVALGFAVIGVVAYQGGIPEPEARLSRADRKHFRAERSRIALERAIAEAEREAGIR